MLALRSLPDTLPGRAEIIDLWPLSQGEIDGFVDAAFAYGADLRTEPAELIFLDSGLAAHLTAGLVGDTQFGGLLESFALSELARQLTWSQASARLYHYRDRDRYEVDAILDNSAGEIIDVEVKAAETVRGGRLPRAPAPAAPPRLPLPRRIRLVPRNPAAAAPPPTIRR